jgi:hypothetical protein
MPHHGHPQLLLFVFDEMIGVGGGGTFILFNYTRLCGNSTQQLDRTDERRTHDGQPRYSRYGTRFVTKRRG